MNDLNEEFVRLFERLFRDLRSPANAIVGFSNVLCEGLAGPTSNQQREFLDDILASATQLLAIIDNNDRRARALITAFGAVVDELRHTTG
jgi:signal transduction histidine kinase